jgi:hypothetical protein
MLKEGELIGAIAIYRQEVRPFTDKFNEIQDKSRQRSCAESILLLCKAHLVAHAAAA